MIIVMQVGATQAQIDAVCEVIRSRGVDPLPLPGEGRRAVGIPANLDPALRIDLEGVLNRLDGVSKVTQTSSPFKLASREYYPQPTVISVKGVDIGPETLTVMAGPCSVEGYEQFRLSADMVKAAGAKVLRGGAFKPRTSPYSFQGLQEEGLRIIRQVAEETGLVTITEVMSADMVETVAAHVDILQIGARSMQNFPLLIEAGKSGKPVFLKRGPSATVDEFLLASEYVLNQGNPHVMLCERGIVAFDRAYTRNTLDLNVVPVLDELTHLPIVVDPSHGTGVAKYVAPLAKAAVVAGADGLMIETHPDPRSALSDGSQALEPAAFAQLMEDIKVLAQVMGRRLS